MRGRTSLTFHLEESATVALAVYDVTGRRVETLLSANWRAGGDHTVDFDARDIASGVYFYRLDPGGQTATRQMVVTR